MTAEQIGSLFEKFGKSNLRIISFTSGSRYLISDEERDLVVFDDESEILHFRDHAPKLVISCWHYDCIDGLQFDVV